MVLLLAGLLLLICYAILIFKYYEWWQNLETYKPSASNLSTRISVIVAARNEEKNIEVLIRSLKNQTYPKELFEIIIVDDNSDDQTVEIVKRFKEIKLLSLKDTNSSKKIALAEGIAIATGELIVVTDSDCTVPSTWLQTIAPFYTENKSVFIAAPVAFHCRNSILEIFQTLDFLMLQGITAATVSSGFHTMCNGANLAYTKEAFYEVDGFKNIDTLASGDDMLLMHKIWVKHPKQVHYLKSKDAIVYTQPMHTWKDLFCQRIRWASKTTYYKDKRIFWALFLVYFFNLYFFVLLIAGFLESRFWIAAIGFLILKTVIELFFLKEITRFYNQSRLLKYFLFLQLLHIFYIVSIGVLSQFGNYQWKGRKLK